MDFDYSKTIFDIFEVLKIIHDFLKRKLHSEPTFPFLRLPLLARNEVIRSMGHKDCINLALASKEAAETIKMARMKTSYAQITISPTPFIGIWKGKMMLYTNYEWKKGLGWMNSTELEKWTDQSSGGIVKNVSRVYNEIEQLFRFENQFTLTFTSDYKKVTTVKEVLSDPTLKNWRYCIFKGNTIDAEELKMILDMASPDKSVAFEAEECPIEFRHENAFKFLWCEYSDTRWVKIEDLYGLNNINRVVLDRTKFTQSEIKEFISYWVNSDIDMFRWMRVVTVESFDPVEVLDGLILIHIENMIICFTVAKATEARKATVLFFCITEISFMLSAWYPGESTSGKGEEFDETIRNKEGVIDLLVEKKRLEIELESTDEENKQSILKRLKQLDDEIDDHGVFFDNGKATVRVPRM